MKTAVVCLVMSVLLIVPSIVNAAPSVAAGNQHVVLLTDTGVVWTWGYNNQGQLGDGTTNNRSLPVSVSISGVMAVAADDNSSYALKTDGTVWAWGANNCGQLGDGTTTSRTSPVAVSGLTNITMIAAGYCHALALKSDGTVWAWGMNVDGEFGNGNTTNSSTPIQITGIGTSGLAVAAGRWRSHVLKTDGTVWSTGYN